VNSTEKSFVQSTFIERAQAAGAFVYVVASTPGDLHNCLVSICTTDILVSTRCHFSPDWVTDVVGSLPGVIIDPDETQLAAGFTGITDVFAGVAETGSIVLSNAHGQSGPVSLFTSRHIAILDANQIVERPRDVFTKSEWQPLMANVVFITGPSATADMGKLVRGVHGPGRLDIILLGGEA
jgi:L-lactate dehydrogenase complex protein LldG